MRTIIGLIIGSLLAIGLVCMAKILGRNTVVGIIVFVSLWLTFCVIDTLRGVRAGYSIQAEIMIHLLLFAIPAVAAYLAARLLH